MKHEHTLHDVNFDESNYFQKSDNIDKIFHEIANEVADLVSKKNHDYGNSYFKLREEWGEQSFGIRLGDKYHRLTNLLHGTDAKINEKIEDTIQDIIGYCLLELAYRKNCSTETKNK